MTEVTQDHEIITFQPLSKAVLNNAKNVFSSNDFVAINGIYEIKRNGALKLLTSLPISYSLAISGKYMTKEYASVTIKLKVKFNSTGIEREVEAIGTCEMDEEVSGKKMIHNMIAKAETRAIKRAVETIFGAVVNALILEIKGSYKV